jgi:hypothetical protein
MILEAARKNPLSSRVERRRDGFALERLDRASVKLEGHAFAALNSLMRLLR